MSMEFMLNYIITNSRGQFISFSCFTLTGFAWNCSFGVLGVVLTRKLSKLPKKKCWFVGSSKVNSSAEIASEFNQNWDTNLRVGYHDCRDYTNGNNSLSLSLSFRHKHKFATFPLMKKIWFNPFFLSKFYHV